MKTKTLIFITSTFFFPFLSGCSLFESDDAWLKPVPPSNTLPPITQTGANTFGCKVNGQVWLPTTVWVDYHNGGMVISANNGYEPHSDIIVTLSEFTAFKQGSYELSANTSYISKGSYRSGKDMYYTDSIYIGDLTINRLDSVNSILSGTFSFDAKHISTGEVIHVTEGRFDNKYN
ncbi:MAG: hypothetical protein K1X81_10025 [Bacteroidia bacterium]|nr:hypothetical protein [Bacteroidia bacterium]